MKCIVCDRCKTIIENPRRCRAVTCARPLKPRTACDKGKVPYRGNDPQQNDLLWEKEICDKCLDELSLRPARISPPIPLSRRSLIPMILPAPITLMRAGRAEILPALVTVVAGTPMMTALETVSYAVEPLFICT